MSEPREFDIAIIGAGIVGAATARALLRTCDSSLVLIEAEAQAACHQSGRNSGVIHSGLYYRPGSHKARWCRQGREQLYRFCDAKGIPYRRCGKLVVATRDHEIPELERLFERAVANGLDGVEQLDALGIREREPAAAGLAGLWVPQTGVIDFRTVTQVLVQDFRELGGTLLTEARVQRLESRARSIRISTNSSTVESRWLVNCAGLFSDRIARLAGLDPEVRIVPFRGEYLRVMPPSAALIRGLVYPVPDVRFPFLGTHLTRALDGRVLAGPNAVPAGKRDGYRRSDLSPRDLLEVASFPGFWRLGWRFWRTGIGELYRSLNPRAAARQIQRLVPSISPGDLRRSVSGVRAQAVDRRGRLLDDFHILEHERMIHVLNAPSPAATAALAIGQHIAELATERFDLRRARSAG